MPGNHLQSCGHSALYVVSEQCALVKVVLQTRSYLCLPPLVPLIAAAPLRCWLQATLMLR
jgi:hypothetical protein